MLEMPEMPLLLVLLSWMLVASACHGASNPDSRTMASLSPEPLPHSNQARPMPAAFRLAA